MSTHPPLNTSLSAFTPAMLDALPVGSRFGRSDCLPIVRCETGWRDEGSGNTPKTVWTSEEVARCFHSRTLTCVGPDQASEPAPRPARWANRAAFLAWSAHIAELAAVTPNAPIPESVVALPAHQTPLSDAEQRWAMEAARDIVTPSATLPDPWPGMIVDVDADDGNRYRATIAFVRSIGERTWIGFAAMGAKDARWNEGHVHEVRTPDGVTLWKRPVGGAS